MSTDDKQELIEKAKLYRDQRARLKSLDAQKISLQNEINNVSRTAENLASELKNRVGRNIRQRAFKVGRSKAVVVTYQDKDRTDINIVELGE